jgi:TIR domain-containing protein
MQWDVFLSHASEDKEDFARPLANHLRDLGLRVWFDEFTLTVGDSLRTSIDKGLAGSRYGIVVISPAFLHKHWTQQELNGLAARQVDGIKVILPVWHNISAAGVRRHSPMLADTVAVLSNTGLENVAKELVRAIGRDEESPVNDREKTARKAVLTDSREAPASAAASQLVAIGPDVLCVGEIVDVGTGEWSIHLLEFLVGEIGTVIRLVDGFEGLDPSERYVLLTAIGDGRRLKAPPSLTRRGNSYVARCPVAPSFPRIAVQDLPTDFEMPPETHDLTVDKKGSIAVVSGEGALSQKIRSNLSLLRGESPFHPYSGSRLQEYYWQFRGTSRLESLFKLEVIRLASIPYNDEILNKEYTPLQCVDRVWDVKPLAEQPVRNRLPLRLSLEVKGLGRWDNDVSVLMPPPGALPNPQLKSRRSTKIKGVEILLGDSVSRFWGTNLQ